MEPALINEILSKYIARADVQKQLRGFQEEAHKAGKAFGHGIASGTKGGTGLGDGATADFADEIITQIVGAVRSQFPKMPSDPEKMFRIYRTPVSKTGQMEYKLFFVPWVVHRSSLYPEGYPDGLENVVVLRSHGSKPSCNSVWNNMAGWEWDYRPHPHANRRNQVGEYREGQHYFIKRGSFMPSNSFLRDAVAQLNTRYKDKGVRVVLHSKYYPDEQD